MYLVATRESDKWQLRIQAELPFSKCPTSEIRLSPIFPVTTKAPPQLPPNDSRFQILLCFPNHPFSLIGRLQAKLNDNRKDLLWFSHGLASLLVISDDAAQVTGIRSVIEGLGEVVAFELWTIEAGTISKVVSTYPKSPPPTLTLPIIEGYPADICGLLAEYCSLVTALHHFAGQYFPEHLRILGGIQGEMRAICGRLSYLYHDGTPLPPDWDLSLELQDFPIAVLAAQHSRSLADQIIQVNTSLGELLGQYYTGAVPVLEHPCPMGAFSLLGIGRAAIALAKIYESASDTFAAFPVVRALKESYGTDCSYVPIFNNISQYKVNDWRKHRNLLDAKLTHTPRQENDQGCHMSYFSGPNGFGASVQSISAAMQVLFDGASTKWSLMTITHEYLHSHVRAILSVLFQVDDQHIAADKKSAIERLCNKFEEIFQGDGSEERMDTDNPISLRNRFAFIILSVCQSMLSTSISAVDIRAMAEIEEGKEIRVTPQEIRGTALHDVLRYYYKPINEHLVHTLDLLYFYESNPTLYIKFLWLTWSTIPDIHDRIGHYLLRTLLSVSVKEDGTVRERFNAAVTKVKKCFKDLLKNCDAEQTELLRRADLVLENEYELAALQSEFEGALRLADMAYCYFFSSKVLTKLTRDELTDELTDGEMSGGILFDFPNGEFQAEDVSSPLAFMTFRAKQRVDTKSNSNPEEILKETCWELLVISSATTLTR